MEKLNYYVTEIATIFRQEKDRYKAHELATPVLKAMGAEKEILFDIFRQNLLNEEFVNRPRHYPTLAFDIYKDDNIGINGNCFMPLPDRSGDLSFQSIHHHGKLLLTTVAAFGPGYDSILFKKGFVINNENHTAQMEVDKNYRFAQGSIEFVDSDQPHVVFFPPDASITYAMFTYASVTNATQKLKNNFIVRKFKEPIRKGLKMFGLLDKAGINAVENFDFYPENGKIMILKNRINFKPGTNENFLTNVFYVLQKAGFNDKIFFSGLKNKYPSHTHLHRLIDEFIKGNEIKDEFYDFHKNVRYVNLSKREILQVVK